MILHEMLIAIKTRLSASVLASIENVVVVRRSNGTK